ncbi:MAG: hypothetical protein HYS22_06180 [Deltaproteobacteria bacterium]|nr:hypothetical protein [Deltaproteobacteria bacterium]
MEETNLKDVYTITERGSEEKNLWTRIGIGFVNKDNSINVVLDAIPVNGRIHIRDRQNKTKKGGD